MGIRVVSLRVIRRVWSGVLDAAPAAPIRYSLPAFAERTGEKVFAGLERSTPSRADVST